MPAELAQMETGKTTQVPDTDEALMQRLQDSREASLFEALVKRHSAFAYRVALAHCGQAALAEEIVQETFLRLAAGRFRYTAQGEGSFRAWFYQLVVNMARDLARSERRTRMRAKSSRYLQSVRQETSAPVTERVEAKSAAVREALCALSEDLRLPLVLHYMEDLPQTEVSRLLKISQPQVSRRIARGLDLLRQRLATGGLALPALAVPGLLKSEGLIEVPASLSHELARISFSPTWDAASEGSRRVAANLGRGFSTGSLTLAGLAACALIAAGIVWLRKPETTTPVATKPVALTAHALDSQPAEAANVLWAWDFNQGPAGDLRVLQSRWNWVRDAQGRGMMSVIKGSDTIVQLPASIPQQPLHVAAECELFEDGIASLDFFWSRGEFLLMPQRNWGSPLELKRKRKSSKRVTTDMYVVGSYVVGVSNGEVTSLREFNAEYPGDRVCILLENLQLEKIVLRTVSLEDIPAPWRNPKDLIPNMKLKDNYPEGEVPFGGLKKE